MNINVQVSPGQIGDVPSSYPVNSKMFDTKEIKESNVSTAESTFSNLENKKLTTSMNDFDTKDIKVKRPSINVMVSTDDFSPESSQTLTQGGMSGFFSQLTSMFESFISTLTKLVDKLVELTAKPAANTNTASTINTPVAETKPTTQTSETSPDLVSDANATKESFKDRTTKYFNETSKGTVSELKMQEAVVMYQLYQKDEEAESIFKTKLAEAKSQGKTGQSAIKAALIETEKSGKIARWESDWVFSLSYRAAQLDDNIKDLKTQNTGSNMPQKLAIETAERTLLAIATGVEIPVNRPVSSTAE